MVAFQDADDSAGGRSAKRSLQQDPFLQQLYAAVAARGRDRGRSSGRGRSAGAGRGRARSTSAAGQSRAGSSANARGRSRGRGGRNNTSADVPHDSSGDDASGDDDVSHHSGDVIVDGARVPFDQERPYLLSSSVGRFMYFKYSYGILPVYGRTRCVANMFLFS